MLQLRDNRYNDIRLIFDEPTHKYTDTLGNSYVSTTTILGKYKQAFDKEFWLKKKAKELHTTEKALEKQWATITTEACDRGNVFHNSAEDGIREASMFKKAVKYLNPSSGQMITVADLPNINHNLDQLNINQFIELTGNKYPEIYKVLKYYVDNGYKIYAEIGAFLIDYLLSGTIDVLLIRDDQFVIGDWKTNRGGLKFQAGYYKKDKAQRPAQHTDVWVPKNEFLLPPLNNLPACNGMSYTMQLSIYAYMVELILGIPNRGLWLAHIDSDFVLNEYGQPKRFPDGLYHIKKNPVEKVTMHKITYLKEEVKRVLSDRYKEISAERVTSHTLFD